MSANWISVSAVAGAGPGTVDAIDSSAGRKIMADPLKLGIIICNRYHTCAGGKCFRSLREREGAFRLYRDREVELVGYTTCDGCPGGNVEYAPEEMKKNGAEVVHLATGLVVGYPLARTSITFSNSSKDIMA